MWNLILRCSEDPLIATKDHRIARRMGVDFRTRIAWQHSRSGVQGRFEEVAGKRTPVHVTVDSLAGIVGVQGNDAVELPCPQVLLQEPYLGLLGIAPEATVQILAGFPLAPTSLESPGIADWIDKEFIELCDLRALFQLVEQLDGGDHARLLVTMDATEDSHPVEC